MNPPRRALAISALGLAVLAGCGPFPGSPKPGAAELRPEEVRDFPSLYGRHCSGCHGLDGRGNGALPLNNPVYLALITDDALRKVIALGVPGTPMPAFAISAGGWLTDDQLASLVKQIRDRWSKPEALGPASPPPYAADGPGDPSRGAKTYAAFCASCHGPSGTGTPKGSSIVDRAYLALVSDQGLRTTILAGRPDLHHPDWRNYLPGRPMTRQELTDLVAWLATRRGVDVAKAGDQTRR